MAIRKRRSAVGRCELNTLKRSFKNSATRSRWGNGLKEKSKTRTRKRQRGGALPTFGSTNKVFIFYMNMISHMYITAIGPLKPVATPDSGEEPTDFINYWESLTDDEKAAVHTKWSNRQKFDFGIYIYPDIPAGRFSGNKIIFYSVKDLDKLATASGKTRDELLKICALPELDIKSLNMDLIKIAFGDNFSEASLQTDEGRAVLERYRALL